MLGRYLLALELAGFIPVSENIDIVKGATFYKTLELKHTRAYLDSVAAARHAAKRKTLFACRVAFCAAAAVSAGMGGYFEMQARSRNQRLDEIDGDYQAAVGGFETYKMDYQNAHDKAAGAMRTRNVFYGIAGAFGLVFGISFVF